MEVSVGTIQLTLYGYYAGDNVCCIYAGFEVVLLVAGMLVDLSVTIMQVTVSVAIMQLEISAAHMQLTDSFCSKCVGSNLYCNHADGSFLQLNRWYVCSALCT